MAKWGEGDPRWIVEERADATNVNNWHWTEKNATSWSKDRIRSLLEGFKVENDSYLCEITELKKCEGEASANNRKAKLIFFYEWEIKADWKGSNKGSDETFEGSIEIPNLSEENEPHELEVRVSTKSSSDEAYKTKEFLRTFGEKRIQNQIGRYITDLKEEFSKGLILPKKSGENAKQTVKTMSAQNAVKNQMTAPIVSEKPGVGVQIRCKRVKDKVKFQCEASDLYRALTEPERVQAFSRNPVQMESEKGGNFTMFSGNVCGRFVELEREKQIVMQWRQKSWPDEHYSTVTLDLDQTDDGTELTLTQTGVPEAEYEKTVEGWKRYYWDAIKQTFGFGASLF